MLRLGIVGVGVGNKHYLSHFFSFSLSLFNYFFTSWSYPRRDDTPNFQNSVLNDCDAELVLGRASNCKNLLQFLYGCS